MMFLDVSGRGVGDVLAISQPAHAWVSGQLIRRWAVELPQPLLLAAEQHDLAWIDWERAPSFDPATGRPHLFRKIGAASHASRWIEAVERAHSAWGSRVALFISRHGTVIYTRFTDRHRTSDADASAAAHYVEQQAPIQAAWAASLSLTPAMLARETDLVAFVDTLSLGLCGFLRLPLDLDGPGVTAGTTSYRLAQREDQSLAYTLDPWPFEGDSVMIDTEARLIAGGRFESETAMRAWSQSARSEPLRLTLTKTG